MTLAEYSLAAFAVLNGGRAVAYFPQMILIYRDPHRATAVSLTTWLLFSAANVATVVYALAVASDHLVAVVFSLNAAGCLAIVLLISLKRVWNRSCTAPGWIGSMRESARLTTASHASTGVQSVDRSARSLRTVVDNAILQEGGF